MIRASRASHETADRTSTLITADKVQGAPIYNTAGESLGSIDDIVIDRKTGNVAYAVMSFGGFLGFGSRYYPIPWLTLKYDPKLDGYVTQLERVQLEGLPAYGRWL